MNTTANQVFSHYELVDNHTGAVLKSYPADKARAARNRADKLDNQYGAVRYVVRMVFVAK